MQAVRFGEHTNESTTPHNMKPSTLKLPRPAGYLDEQYVGKEPKWDTEQAEKMTAGELDNAMRASFYYYNYFYSQKELKPFVTDYMSRNGYTKEQIKLFQRSSDKAIGTTACNLAICNFRGMPFRKNHTEYLAKEIQGAIDSMTQTEQSDSVQVVVAPIMTIQDRMNEKTADTIGELEGHYDEVLSKCAPIKVFDFLRDNGVAQNQLGKYQYVYQKRLGELQTAKDKKDAQITEAYSHYKPADFKRMIGFINSILADIDQYRGVKQATKKLRVNRAPSKEKLAAGVKYAKEDKELKLVSIKPADIIGKTILYCYDVKTRKFMMYQAEVGGTLGVKGTTLIGFDQLKSVQKTLRSPATTLSEFGKASKVALRKFMDNIKTVDTKASGRLSANIVLLKAI